MPEYQPVAAVPQPGWFANANTVETGYVTAGEPSTSEVAEAEAEPSADAEVEAAEDTPVEATDTLTATSRQRRR